MARWPFSTANSGPGSTGWREPLTLFPRRGRADEALVEGEAERLDRRGGPMAAADPHDAAGYFLNGAPVRIYPRDGSGGA